MEVNACTVKKQTKWTWVAIIGIGSFVSYSARSILSPLLVLIERDLDLSHDISTQLYTFQAIGATVTAFCSALLLSRFTPQRMYAASLFFGGLMLVIASFIPVFFAIQYTFLLAGIFFGIYNPTYLAILSEIVSEEHWARSTAYVELGVIISFIATPLWIAIFSGSIGWRGCLLLVGIVNILGGMWYYFFGRGGVNCMERPTMSAFLHLLRLPQTYSMMICYSVILTAEFAVYSVASVYFVSEQGLSLVYANTLLSLSRIASIIMVPVGGYIADRYNPKWGLYIFIVLQAISLYMLVYPVHSVQIAGLFLQAGASSFGFPLVFSIIPYSFAKENQSLVIALTSPIASIVGTGIVPALFGILGAHYTFALGFEIFAFACILMSIPVFLLRKIHSS
ncbi:MAG: MFS transporter [Desulfovibrionaceae bacterium]